MWALMPTWKRGRPAKFDDNSRQDTYIIRIQFDLGEETLYKRGSWV